MGVHWLFAPQVLTVQKGPHEDGIHVFGAGEANIFTVQPGCTHTLRIQWVPSATGSMRCVLSLAWSGFHTLQVNSPGSPPPVENIPVVRSGLHSSIVVAYR